ncbi:MAG: dioxygenase [Myxococcales bacterium]|nr:dioxygenase [Myxococcales bacterium]
MKPQPSNLPRRRFLKHTALGVIGTWVGGRLIACDMSPQGAIPDAVDAPPDGLPPTCGELTEPNIEGPFFLPDSPLRSVLVDEGTTGTRIVISGRVVSSTTCEPIEGAVLDFWSADHAGAYDNVGFELRGHQFTGAEGDYHLTSVLPGHYLNGAQYRPAHVHVKVAAPGHKLLTTQLYFAGDPFNDVDAFIRPSLIMTTTDVEGAKHATFHFVLQPL